MLMTILLVLIFLIAVILAYGLAGLVFWGIGSFIVWAFTFTFWYGLAIAFIVSILTGIFGGKK